MPITADPSKPENTDEDAPKALTHEDVHGAISDRFKRWEVKLQEREKAIDAKLAKIDKLDQLDSILERLNAQSGEPAEAAAKPVAKPVKGDDSEKLRKRLDALELERETERKTAAQQEERSELSAALSRAGITNASQAKAAVALLYTEEKRVARGSDGKIIFRGIDKYGDAQDLDLDEGIKQWASTEDGKVYLPAKEARGAGSKPPNGKAPRAASGPQSTKRDKSNEAMIQIFEALLDR